MERSDPSLLAAALTGLLSLTGCGGGEGEGEPVVAEGEECSEHSDRPSVLEKREEVLITEAEFRAKCDEQGGWVQVHPTCGGVNSCRGFSYDSDVDEWIEHSCRAVNTCTGFTCVVCSRPRD